MSNTNPNEYIEKYGVSPTPLTPPPAQHSTKSGNSRRRFIQGLLATGAIGVGGSMIYSSRLSNTPFSKGATQDFDGPNGSDPTGEMRSDANPNRVLVVVELVGGNDGLSMVVPYTSGAYYDVRPKTAIPQEEVLPLNDQLGLNPKLSRLHSRGVTVISGVGSKFDNLSHFTSEAHWQVGDLTGDKKYRSGFLARCIDPIVSDAPVIGLATNGYTPYFTASQAPSIALSNINQLNFLTRNEKQKPKTMFQDGLARFANNGEETLIDTVGTSYGDLLDFGRINRADKDTDNPVTELMATEGGALGHQLAFAADMIEANTGVRVIHTQVTGYDTHNGQRGRHDNLMAQLDAAVGGFLDRMDASGNGDNVLVAVYSEFGRRLAENNSSGTDHGQGSNTLIVGAIAPQIIGEVNVASPDEHGNIKTTIPFDSLQRSCAEWLGLNGESIFPDSNTEILF